MDGDQSRSDASRPRDARPIGRSHHARSDRCRNVCHDFYRRAIAAGRESHLDRLGRRLGAGDARRRPELVERHAARSPAADPHQPGRSIAAYRRNCLRRREPVSGRGSRRVRLQDRRFRQDVDENRRRHRRGRLCAIDSGRYGAPRSAVPRHRARHLYFLRRRRALAAVPPQSAGDASARYRSRKERSSHRHAWAGLLRARPYPAPPRDRAGDGAVRGISVHTRRRDPRPGAGNHSTTFWRILSRI